MKQTIAALACLLASSTVAFAQGAAPPQSRGFIAISGGMQLASNGFDDSTTFDANAEQGRFDSDYTVDHGPAFNIAGGATVWRQLIVGAGVTRFSRSTPTTLSGSIPHPFFFNRPRTVAGDVGGLKREELGVNLRVATMFPVARRFEVMVFGGPSFFQVKQDVVTELTYTEAYPYDEAQFTGGERTSASVSKMGFNAGADLGFFFTRQLGVGFVAQYAGTTVDLPSADGGTQEVKAGGLQIGGGLRLRF